MGRSVCLIIVWLSVMHAQEIPSEYAWHRLVSQSRSSLSSAFLPSYIDLNRDILLNPNVSLGCRQDIHKAIEHLHKLDTWALKMFNSWGRLPASGALAGTLTDYGDYDQCLSLARRPLAEVSKLAIQYCLVDVSMPMPPQPESHNYFLRSPVLPDDAESISNTSVYRHLDENSSVFYYVYLRLGICLPASCESRDIQLVARNNLDKFGLKLKRVKCETPTAWKPNFIEWVAIVLLVVIFSLTALAAIADRLASSLNVRYRRSASYKMLLWFSPLRNIHKLICSKSIDELTCLHGIRVITMFWIITGHTLEWNNLNTVRDTFTMRDKLSDPAKQPLLKAHYSVDTFFYLSGLLTSYVTLKYTNGNLSNFKLSSFFWLRYLRLTPQMGVFLVLLSIFPVMFNGPVWNDYIGPVTDTCYKTWWRNIFYIHNLFDVTNICAIHTWYLSCDMQLHWISLIPIVLMLKNRLLGLTFTRVFIVVCVAITAFTWYSERLPPGAIMTTKTDFLDEEGRPSNFLIIFYRPWTHVNVFFIGFLFGAFLQTVDLSNYALAKSTKYACWLVALLGNMFCIYSTFPWVHGRPYDRLWSAILYPTNTTVWALVLTLTIWLCATNNGSFIGRFLSWSGFRPLSRMTFSVYLTHVWVLWTALGTRRDLIDMSSHSALLLVAGVIVASYLVGFLFTILFDTPVLHLIDFIKRSFYQTNLDIAKDSANGRKMSNNNNKEIPLMDATTSHV